MRLAPYAAGRLATHCLLFISSWLLASQAWAQEPDWVLIPDDKRAAVWRVHVDGRINRLDFSRPPGSAPQDLNLQPSPDQKKVVYSLNHDLWLFELGKGQYRQLTRVGQAHTQKFASVSAHFLAWASDGTELLYRVESGETESQGDGPAWAVKMRKADYGVKIVNLSNGAITPAELGARWTWSSSTWDRHGRLFAIVSAASNRPLDEELHAYDFRARTTSRLIDERAWWGIPQVSRDGKWLAIRAGKKVPPEPGPARDSGMRSKIVKVNAQTREVIDATPLGRWAEFNGEALSPSGASLAYFRRNLKHPNDQSGTLVVNAKPLFESTGRLDLYWIDENRLAYIRDRLLNDGRPQIGVLDVPTGRPITLLDLPPAR